MATVSSPYGFKPVRMIGNRVVGGALPTNQYRIKQNYAGVIPYGSPVVLSGSTTYTSGNACTITYSGTVITLTFASAVSGLYAGMPVTISGTTGTTVTGISGGTYGTGITSLNATWVLATGAAGTVFTIILPTGAGISGTIGGTAVVIGGAGFLQVPTNGSFNTNGDAYVGIFQGCQYINAQNGQPQWDQWYPGNVNSAGMVGYVVDDPDAVFQVQAAVANFDALANVGNSFQFTQPSPLYSTVTKDSTIQLAVGTATATTAPFKVVDVAQTPDNVNGSGFVDVYVVAQAASHQFRKAN